MGRRQGENHDPQRASARNQMPAVDKHKKHEEMLHELAVNKDTIKNMQKEREIQKLKWEENMENINSERRQERKRMEKDKDKLANTITALQEDLKILKKEKLVREGQMKELLSSIEKYGNTTAQLQEELAAALKEIIVRKGQIKDLMALIDKQTHDRSNLEEQIKSYQKQVSDVEEGRESSNLGYLRQKLKHASKRKPKEEPENWSNKVQGC